jgi:fatty-acid desaturase
MSHIAFIKKPIARVSGSSTDSFRPNWLNLSFLIPVHSAGLILWPLYLAMGGDIQWQEIAVMIFMFAMGVIGINVGYHRALAHRSFKMSPVLKFLALLLWKSFTQRGHPRHQAQSSGRFVSSPRFTKMRARSAMVTRST